MNILKSSWVWQLADDKLVDISTAEKDIFCKRIFPLVANLKEKVQSLVNFLKACQFSDVQLRESIDSIKASCMGLFEVLDDLRGNRVTINNKNNRSTSLSGRNSSTESDSNSENKDNDDENSDEDDQV